MATMHRPVPIPGELIETIRSYPVSREIEHCGIRFSLSPFEFQAQCPQCGTVIKVRSLSGVAEIEDVFDAVLEWMNQPGANEVANRRQAAIAEDEET